MYVLSISIGGDEHKYSKVSLQLVFERQIEYHILRIYLPSALLVLVAGFSVSVPLTHFPGKLVLTHPQSLCYSDF